ncbi:unnamed protein product [Symbiodinium sp. CCMP2592]|nr:unnamed protein product [Symbiodinium sp. CCMP2592]
MLLEMEQFTQERSGNGLERDSAFAASGRPSSGINAAVACRSGLFISRFSQPVRVVVCLSRAPLNSQVREDNLHRLHDFCVKSPRPASTGLPLQHEHKSSGCGSRQCLEVMRMMGQGIDGLEGVGLRNVVEAVKLQQRLHVSLQRRLQSFLSEVMMRRVHARLKVKGTGGGQVMIALQELVRDEDWILLTETEHAATRSSRVRSVVRENLVLIANIMQFFSIRILAAAVALSSCICRVGRLQLRSQRPDGEDAVASDNQTPCHLGESNSEDAIAASSAVLFTRGFLLDQVLRAEPEADSQVLDPDESSPLPFLPELSHMDGLRRRQNQPTKDRSWLQFGLGASDPRAATAASVLQTPDLLCSFKELATLEVVSCRDGFEAFDAPGLVFDRAKCYKEQILASKRALDKLRADECWTRVDCDGDYIRRVAGTVGTVSPLFKIKDALMEVYSEDPPNLPDLEDVLKNLSQLDYQAYCTIFAINGGPESFRKYMAEASNSLDVVIKDFAALAKAGKTRAWGVLALLSSWQA